MTETFAAQDLPALRALAAREREHGGFTVAARMDADGRVVRDAGDGATGEWTERWGDDRHPVLLFGAGHVGRALAIALAPLPVAVTWLDPRADAFPPAIPANAALRLLADPAEAVAAAPAGASVMVMTHSHPLDLAVVAAALARDDLGPVGLIGSKTKRARFLARLREAGLADAAAARLVCPIGVESVAGKEPAVIAAVAAAQILQWRERAASAGQAGPVRSEPGRTRPAPRRRDATKTPPAHIRGTRGR